MAGVKEKMLNDSRFSPLQLRQMELFPGPECIRVSYIPDDLDEEAVAQEFGIHGDIKRVKILKEPKGAAYIWYEQVEVAKSLKQGCTARAFGTIVEVTGATPIPQAEPSKSLKREIPVISPSEPNAKKLCTTGVQTVSVAQAKPTPFVLPVSQNKSMNVTTPVVPKTAPTRPPLTNWKPQIRPQVTLQRPTVKVNVKRPSVTISSSQIQSRISDLFKNIPKVLPRVENKQNTNNKVSNAVLLARARQIALSRTKNATSNTNSSRVVPHTLTSVQNAGNNTTVTRVVPRVTSTPSLNRASILVNHRPTSTRAVTSLPRPISSVSSKYITPQNPTLQKPVIKHRPVTTLQRPATNLQKPATTIQRPATTLQRPATTFQRPATTIQRSVTTLQPPFTSIQRPVTTIQRNSTILPRPVASASKPTILARQNIVRNQAQVSSQPIPRPVQVQSTLLPRRVATVSLQNRNPYIIQ